MATSCINRVDARCTFSVSLYCAGGLWKVYFRQLQEWLFIFYLEGGYISKDMRFLLCTTTPSLYQCAVMNSQYNNLGMCTWLFANIVPVRCKIKWAQAWTWFHHQGGKMNKMWDIKFFYSLCYNFHVAFFLQECNQESVKIVCFLLGVC